MNWPSLAYLYKGFPWYFNAEKNGGICSDSPINENKLSRIIFSESSTLDSKIIFPDESSVSVDLPNQL